LLVAPCRMMPIALKSHRILVVDDLRDSADIMAEVFELLGHTVMVAYDGITAIAIASSFSPQVVLLDVHMNGMNGFELAQSLRKMPNVRNAAMIALTGSLDATTAARAAVAGIDTALKKPSGVAQLLLAMTQVIASRMLSDMRETLDLELWH
jgi:CheY-like chemotaxis protein